MLQQAKNGGIQQGPLDETLVTLQKQEISAIQRQQINQMHHPQRLPQLLRQLSDCSKRGLEWQSLPSADDVGAEGVRTVCLLCEDQSRWGVEVCGR